MSLFERFLDALDYIATLKFLRKNYSKKVPRTIKKASDRVRKQKAKLERNYKQIYGKNPPRRNKKPRCL